jgi:ribosomal protein S18 acetylase RimI-like enzyme
MTPSLDKEIENVAWDALTTEHASLAISSALARRYPADVVPIAAVRIASSEALAELRGLLAPGENLWIARAGDELPKCLGLDVLSHIIAWQMIYPASGRETASESNGPAIDALTSTNAAEMVALTDVAFPGFFRRRTYLMGRYYGIRAGGELVSMAGERLTLPGMREVSAVCTHPEHRGKGYAAQLIRHVLASHSAAGLQSFLHVSDFNHSAIALYERLGFVKTGATRFTRVRRSEIAETE